MNYCVKCADEVGNDAFSVCEKCWGIQSNEFKYVLEDEHILRLINQKIGHGNRIEKVVVTFKTR